METEVDENDPEYANAVKSLENKLAAKAAQHPVINMTGDKGIDENPGPELGEMPATRGIINRKLKQKLKQKGYRPDEKEDKNKKLLTDVEFHKDFMLKMKLMKEIQDELDQEEEPNSRPSM